MSKWKRHGSGVSDPEYDSMYRGPSRGREGFDGRRIITEQEHYANVRQIRQYLFRLFIIGAFLFLIFVGAVAALMYFSFEVAAHRRTLENIEEQTEQALIFLMEVLNSTNEVTKDITSVYSRAKMAHRRNVGTISEEEYAQYLSNNGVNAPSSANELFANENHDNETYATHFMHILLRSLPLEDEDEMTVRFRNFFDGVDSLMFMLGEANRTGLVPNTTMIEKKINEVLYSDRSHHLAIQGANLASQAMGNSHMIIQKALDTNHSIAHVLARLDQLSQSKLVTILLENKHDVLSGVGYLGGEAYEALHTGMKFVKSDEGDKLIGDAEEIVEALNKFHTAKRATQVLQLLLDFGSRTLNIDIEEEEEETEKKEEVPAPQIVRAIKKSEPAPSSVKQLPTRNKKNRKKSYN
ncbi:MAG: hypothetical protein ACTSUE_09850 [Promethearchaeota archaeon]